jgi:hypothetical protein
MRTNRAALAGVVAVVALAGLIAVVANLGDRPEAPTPGPTSQPASQTPAPQPSARATLEPTLVPTLEPTATSKGKVDATEATVSPALQAPGDGSAPYPDAPLCPDTGTAHDNSSFHTIWDSERGCHYDHEHGQNPFTPAVEATFPDFDLRTLLGGGGIGHTNPSSPIENTDKHGGFKWNVQLVHPEDCAGFENAEFGANASVIQYHGFGDEAIELEARVHSTAALVRQCSVSNPTDYGYIYVVQYQDYGQRITPYQGTVVPYPNQPDPAYDSPRGPYISFDCVGAVPQCRPSLEDVVAHARDADSNWTSKPTGNGFRGGSQLFQLLWRVRDSYQLFRWSDQTHPFTFDWLCSSDNGLTYDPAGCRYNNSTSQVHEIAGSLPATWDNLAGFDTDTRAGRITAEGFVTAYGELMGFCHPSIECFPIKLVNAFVGTWGSVLVYSSEGKGTNIEPLLPERDIFFCGGQVCADSSPGAVASGWIGPEN